MPSLDDPLEKRDELARDTIAKTRAPLARRDERRGAAGSADSMRPSVMGPRIAWVERARPRQGVDFLDPEPYVLLAMHSAAEADHPIVLFDGECNFCDASVNFIIDRDPSAVFRFASRQSSAGKRIMR